MCKIVSIRIEQMLKSLNILIMGILILMYSHQSKNLNICVLQQPNIVYQLAKQDASRMYVCHHVSMVTGYEQNKPKEFFKFGG